MEEIKNDEYYGLKEYHASCVELMDEVDRICRKYGITYHLIYGSLLGAMRHKGFIPWDDDMDVCFSREGLNEFLSHQDEIDPRFKIVTPYDFKDLFWDDITRIVYVGKNINESNEVSKKFNDLHNCIFVDLFIYDEVKGGLSFKLQDFRNKILYGYAMSRRPVITYKKYKSFVSKAQAFILATIGKLFKLERILKKKDKLMSKHNNKGYKYLSNLGAFPACPTHYFPKEYLAETIDVEFEGRKYMAPKCYDELLTFEYGDWRKLPPEEDRVGTHSNIIL